MNNGKVRDRTLTVRLSDEMYLQLAEAAAESGKAPAVWAMECIESYLVQNDPAEALYRQRRKNRSHAKRLSAAI